MLLENYTEVLLTGKTGTFSMLFCHSVLPFSTWHLPSRMQSMRSHSRNGFFGIVTDRPDKALSNRFYNTVLMLPKKEKKRLGFRFLYHYYPIRTYAS